MPTMGTAVASLTLHRSQPRPSSAMAPMNAKGSYGGKKKMKPKSGGKKKAGSKRGKRGY